VTERLAKRMPTDKLVVSESGIQKRDDVVRVMEAGARAMLIGESLLRAASIESKIQELLGSSAPSKEEVPPSRWV
jgi:indole-3-glycerol phosphate synthase